MKITDSAAALVLVAIVAIPAAAGSWTAFESLPDATPVEVQVGDNPRIYFTIRADRPLVVPVEGPVKLRVTTRAILPRGSTGVVTYEVRATEAGRLLDRISTETSAASEAKVEGAAYAVGKSRRLNFDVPAGRHRVTLEVSGTNSVLARIQQRAGTAGEAPTVSLTPIRAGRSVLVSEGEKIIPYYTSRKGQPVVVRVVGPTSLELLTRLDFDSSMRGTIAYWLRIAEGGRTLREAELRTTKATTAAYTNLPDRVPSKFDRIVLPVPEGTHEIAVELLQPAGGAAEIHARIPEPTVGEHE
jgi:hypothetical protein